MSVVDAVSKQKILNSFDGDWMVAGRGTEQRGRGARLLRNECPEIARNPRALRGGRAAGTGLQAETWQRAEAKVG